MPRFHLPEELGVLCALVLLVVVIGMHNSDFVRSDNLFNLIASNSFFGMIALAAVFLLALGEIDLSVGWNFNLLRRDRGADDDARLEPLDRRRSSASSSAACSASSTACSRPGLRLPVIIVTLGTYSAYPRALARAEPLGGRRAAGRQRHLLPVLAELRRQGADARDHLRRARDRAAGRAAANALRLPRPGDRQQPRGRAARRHPGSRARGSSCSVLVGARLRPRGRLSVGRVRRDRHQLGQRLPADGGRGRDHRRHPALRRQRHGRSARSSAR